MLYPHCPDYEHAYFFRGPTSQGYACRIEGCDFGAIASYIPEFVNDTTIYRLYVTSLDPDRKRLLSNLRSCSIFFFPNIKYRKVLTM